MTRGTWFVCNLKLPGFLHEEIAFTEQAILSFRPDFIGEWGTNRGSSARILYELARINDISTDVHTVELPASKAHLGSEHPGGKVGEFIRDCEVTMHEGDGAPVCIDWYSQSQADRPFFFVDGNHEAENVLRELKLLYFSAPEAVLLLHDTNGPPGDAIRAFFEQFPKKYDCEVLIDGPGMTKLTPYAKN